jgi:glutathione S-transferase
MYRLYGIPTQNTLKVGYVLDAIGVDYEYQAVDLAKKEQKTEAFLKVNPIGKVPALKHNDFSMFESGAMCRYIANVEKSDLYPEDAKLRAQNDQWIDFMGHHLGRWFSTLFFERVLRKALGFGEPDPSKVDEALGFIDQQIAPVETHLSKTGYFVGSSLSVADLVAFSYIEQAQAVQFDLSKYPNISKWHSKISALESVKKTKSKIKFNG